jgi:hypothetical protein
MLATRAEIGSQNSEIRNSADRTAIDSNSDFRILSSDFCARDTKAERTREFEIARSVWPCFQT